MKLASLAAMIALHGMGTDAARADPSTIADQHIEAALDRDGSAAVGGINALSIDLYKAMITPGGNLFLSPASVSTAVGLAYRGARGTTAEGLRTALHFPAPPDAYLAANGALLGTMNFAGKDRELRVVNALWLQQGLPLKGDFTADMETHAAAALHRVDYRGDAEAARAAINRWVSGETRHKIEDLLHRDDVTEYTRVTLISTIYWKGLWGRPFPAADTRIEPFTRLDGRQVPASLMHLRSDFQAIERGGVKLVAMPYIYGEVAMIALLPVNATAFPRFEQKLDANRLAGWIDDLLVSQPRETILTLPRMHLRSRVDLAATLGAMGAQTAFGDDADFSGMATIPYPGEVPGATGLKIKHVIHEAVLDIDERSTEAAAATAVTMDIVITSKRLGPPPPPPFVFRADHPFLFLLRDLRTGANLFIGRYVTPDAAAPPSPPAAG